jgi:hypothetical protein
MIYRVTDKKNGEVVDFKDLEIAKGMIRVTVSVNNRCGIKDSKNNYKIEVINE